MNRRTLVLLTASILAVGIGSYAACSMELAGDTESLGGGVTPEPDPDIIPPSMADAGPPPELPPTQPEAPTAAPDPLEGAPSALCAQAQCGEGQTCCPIDGQCYASSCADCCPIQDARPAPRIEAPDPTTVETGGLAGPEPPAPVPPSVGGDRPPGVGPGPMPPVR